MSLSLSPVAVAHLDHLQDELVHSEVRGV
jgi:hypothetical protein